MNDSALYKCTFNNNNNNQVGFSSVPGSFLLVVLRDGTVHH